MQKANTVAELQRVKQPELKMAFEFTDNVFDGTISIVRVPALVISLEKHFESRGLPSKQLLSEMDCVESVEILKATTPDDFDLKDVAHHHVFATLQHWFNHVSVRDITDARQVACALSHMRAWQRCVELNTPLLIAEDDVCTHRDQLLQNQVALSRVPTDAQLVSLINSTGDFMLGFLKNMWQSPEQVTPVFNEFSGLQCYVLWPSGAQLLLTCAMPVVMHVDRYVSDSISAGLRVYRCGHSSAFSALTFATSTLAHSPSITWLVVLASFFTVSALIVTCAALAIRLYKVSARLRQM